MTIKSKKIIEDGFYFVVLAFCAYLVWRIFNPFFNALALAAIITTICYPLYEKIHHKLPTLNAGVAAFFAVCVVFVIVIIPVSVLISLLLREALYIYTFFNTSDQMSFFETIARAEDTIQMVIPGFSIDAAAVVQQFAVFIADNFVRIFTWTASSIFFFFIALLASYYFFKDGKKFILYLVRLSPLNDDEDTQIISKLFTALRSVVLGRISVAVLQGILTAIGLAIFGFDRAILWGSVATIGALVPGIGTTIIFAPAVGYLLYMGEHLPALLLAIWGALAVGLIDNILGPHLMSRGSDLHPFLILLAVLGGIAFFGPLGFVLGPVVLSLFSVLLELYHLHANREVSTK